MVGALLGFVRMDIRACHQLLDPGVGKLLQYWVQKAAAVLASYPTAAPACWQALLEVPLSAHQELALLSLKGAAEGANAAALAEALRGKVVPGAVRLLVACLGGATSEDQLRVSWRGGEGRAGGGVGGCVHGWMVLPLPTSLREQAAIFVFHTP